VINLALTMAQAGNKILIVEADLRRPSIYNVFGLEREPGLTDIILGNYKWEEVVKGITDFMMGKLELAEIMRTPGMDNLSLITCGSIPPNPAELLSSPKLSEFISEVEQNFDYIIYDTPPILPVADTSILSQRIDGTLLVYEVGKVARGVLKRAKSQIDAVKGSVPGVILNNVKAEMSPDYYKYHMNYYYGSPEKEMTSSYAMIGKTTQDYIANLMGPFSKTVKSIWKKVAMSFASLFPRWFKILVIVLSILVILIGILWQLNLIQGGETKKETEQEKFKLSQKKGQVFPYAKTILLAPTSVQEVKADEAIEVAEHTAPESLQVLPPSPRYVYSLLISSNRLKENAIADMNAVRSQGYPAYFCLADLNGKGELYRVFAGLFEKEMEAREVAKKIKGPFSTSLLSTPYSLEIGLDSSKEAAQQDLEKWEKKGYYPYLLPEQGDQKIQILLGAFAAPGEFTTLSQQLKAEGISYRVVRR
jgi:capsular exopolysaccharide synthesis family protein